MHSTALARATLMYCYSAVYNAYATLKGTDCITLYAPLIYIYQFSLSTKTEMHVWID